MRISNSMIFQLAVTDLSNTVTGKDRGICQSDLIELHQSDVGPECIAHDLLHRFFPGLGFQVPEGQDRLLPYARQHQEKGIVPLGNRKTSGTDHGSVSLAGGYFTGDALSPPPDTPRYGPAEWQARYTIRSVRLRMWARKALIAPKKGLATCESVVNESAAGRLEND